jgi:hypothetical protein
LLGSRILDHERQSAFHQSSREGRIARPHSPIVLISALMRCGIASTLPERSRQ